ncbi:HET-domain-containing protein, partial [Mollisia scopiformis]
MSKNYVAGSEWGDSTRSQQSWTCVHKWLETCIQSHKSCSSQPSVASWKPTRLLDLGPMGAKLLPRLIEHEEIPAGVVYATLSHCWGSAKVFKLQKGSISTAKNQVSFRHLSKTFQDAVEACRRMKIRYLWIDSLCIIQDSSEDWDAEASRMEYVYNHCVINIAASHALDGGWGLHTDRDPLILQPCPLTVTWDDGKPMDMLCADLDDWIKRFDSEPLSTRGWVVQERLLSPRICHFSGTQIIWECNEAFASESFPLGFTSNDHKFNIRNLRGLTSLTTSSEDHLKWDCWRDVIRHYSSAGLSFERDKLVAISGIIRRMRDVFQTEYLAGLWWKGIEYQLLWAVHREGKNMPTRSSVFIAPTWSWASLNGAEIDLYSHTNTQTTPSLYRGRYLLCRAIDAQVVPASSTTICTDGHIHMQCFLVPAFITPSTFGWYDIAVPIHEKRLGRQPLISLFTIIDVHMTNRGELNFWLMPILDGLEDKHLEGLLLYSNNHEEGIFRRYGSFRLRGVIDLDNLWKSVFEFEASALEARHSNIGLYDKVWKYQIGSKKEEKYEKCDA